MTHTHLRWIELADERHFCETAMFDRTPRFAERQHLHLGAAIVSLPSRIIGALSGHHGQRRPG